LLGLQGPHPLCYYILQGGVIRLKKGIMPELPEVETTVRGLRKRVVGKLIKDVWTDWRKLVKRPKSFSAFRKGVRGKTIKGIKRRGKNILIEIGGEKIILIHQKMTGHLLFGRWIYRDKKWLSKKAGPLKDDSKNRFIHLMFELDRGQLALSDVRKFAKVELWEKESIKKVLGVLGPEPMESSFSFNNFKKALYKRKKGKIKQVLMDQNVIAGIGNIYSDEILWNSKINPFRDINSLKEGDLKKIYLSIKKILKKGIEAKGDSVSDYRNVEGEKGGFSKLEKVYRKEGQKCFFCKSIIIRKKIGGRSAHFCPRCQK